MRPPAPPPDVTAQAELGALRLWQRFHVRLTLLYGSAVLVTLTGLVWLAYSQAVGREMEALQRRLLTVAELTAFSLDADAIVAAPVAPAGPTHAVAGAWIAQALEADPEIESIYVLLSTPVPGQLVFFQDRSRSREGAPGEPYDAHEVPKMLEGLSGPTVEDEPLHDSFGTTLSGYAPLRTRAGQTVGVVGVDIDAARVDELKRNILVTAAEGYAVALLLLGGTAVLVARLLREPLLLLISGSAAVARGLLSTRLRLIRQDEFGVLARHFNQMAAGLEEREQLRATFGRYMSEEVARALLANPEMLKPGGEEREVTVLFSDIRGYSTIAEKLQPAQVVDLLNRYLEAMNARIDANGGCVIEFLGDAILAVFGAPMPLAGHPDRAVRCALEMRAELERLNAEWEQSGLAHLWKDHGLDRLAVRVGVHTGRVVAGNLGSAHRMKYAVIGDAVNVAARLEALNKTLDTDLLMSEAVFCELPDDLARLAKNQGEHQVKGRGQKVQVWSM